MLEMFQMPFMIHATLACLMLAVLLSYFGVHVVSRCIVFIDLALAQISSVGVAFALMTGGNPMTYSIAFTLVGAIVFSVIHPKDKRVPQEAVIGIIYAVASAVAILLISKTPHGDGDVTAILFGQILAVTTHQLIQMAMVFGAIALLHLIFYSKFRKLSFAHHEGEEEFTILNIWNLLFYLSLALVISYAIRTAGVLLVFSYLIVPSVSALFMAKRIGMVFLLAPILAILTSLGGLYASYTIDLPTGATIVACFGITFCLASGIKMIRGRLEKPMIESLEAAVGTR